MGAGDGPHFEHDEGVCLFLKANEWLTASLAQLVERKALNLVVVGSSPTVGVSS